MIHRAYAVYFSPAGSTGAVTEHIAGLIAGKCGVPCKTIDFTLPEMRAEKYRFDENDLVIFGMPTYAGRVPNKALPFVQSLFEGNGALAVSLVTYGNRNFDSSLTELTEELTAKGCRVLSAGAWVCRHVFSEKIAARRPDIQDHEKMEVFADEVVRRLATLETDGIHYSKGLETEVWKSPVIRGGEPVAPYYIPKGEDGKPAKFLKAKPLTDTAKCTNCGICADVCPLGSVSKENYAEVPGICIKCQACVVKCPEGAKYFDDAAFLSHVRMLENNFTVRKEPEWYLSEVSGTMNSSQ
ncbi:MAG: 4Fe-4S binding protein [Lachnospiraceae bacterium]|nr:4Fe-4S binding protein [Lachnospiraceae bacterium]